MFLEYPLSENIIQFIEVQICHFPQLGFGNALPKYFHHRTISNFNKFKMSTTSSAPSARVLPTYTAEGHVDSIYKNLCNIEKVVQQLPLMKSWLISTPNIEQRNQLRVFIAKAGIYTNLYETFQEIYEAHIGDLSTGQRMVVVENMESIRVAQRALARVVEQFEMALEGNGLEME